LDTITSYLAKDSVEGTTVDGTGATAWLVTRYLSDTLGDSWTPNETYTVTPSTQTIDMTETTSGLSSWRGPWTGFQLDGKYLSALCTLPGFFPIQ
jgi:hypothetical protein